MFFVAILVFFYCALLFVGAVFDVDWILKVTRGDRSYGRTFARIFYGFYGLFGMIVLLTILLQ